MQGQGHLAFYTSPYIVAVLISDRTLEASIASFQNSSSGILNTEIVAQYDLQNTPFVVVAVF